MRLLRWSSWTSVASAIVCAATSLACSVSVDAGTTPDPTAPSTSPSSSTAEEPKAMTPVDVTDVVFSTGPLVTPYDRTAARLEVSALVAKTPLQVTVVGTKDGVVEIGDALVPTNTPYTVTLPSLSAATSLTVAHLDPSGNLVEQAFATLPADFPKYTTTGSSTHPGRVFLTPYAWAPVQLQPYAVVLDEAGAPLFYRRLFATTTDFKWHTLPSGATRYSYISNGDVTIMDESFAVIRTVRLLPTKTHDALAADAHEFLLLDEDHYILAAYEPLAPGNVPPELAGANANPYVLAAVIQEVQGGDVVFEWNSAEHPELYARSTEGHDYANAVPAAAADYVHFNSLDIDEDGDWLVSLRHVDEVLKIHKPDGHIVWSLGGFGDDFGLSADQRFSHQHYVRRQSDGTLLLFDNGNAHQATRIVELGVDDSTHAVTSFHALAPPGRYSLAMGSVQKLDPSTYFIGWGAHTAADSDVSEVDRATGQETWSLTFVDDYYSYRALKKPD